MSFNEFPRQTQISACQWKEEEERENMDKEEEYNPKANICMVTFISSSLIKFFLAYTSNGSTKCSNTSIFSSRQI